MNLIITCEVTLFVGLALCTYVKYIQWDNPLGDSTHEELVEASPETFRGKAFFLAPN